MSDFTVDKEWAKATCKMGEGEACCKYLVVGGGGLECAKFQIELARLIHKRIEEGNFKSKGDNCLGKPDELANFLNT